MNQYVRLGVNIDHVATLRNARGGQDPHLLQMALAVEEAGADGITIHLREDRRHITDEDVWLLRSHLRTPMNLEMAATCLLYTSPSPRDGLLSRMPSSA